MATFANPASTDDMIEAVSKLETIEEERVRGVHTTHMRGVLSIGAVQGPFDFLGRRRRCDPPHPAERR